MSERRDFDAIVVGLGAMGSATLFHLARRGARVLGLEQFGRGHDRGSSHGDSRIIRETYFEHPLYVPLVRRAHALWRELESISGTPLMTIKGGLMIGPADGTVVTGTLRSAREHDLPHEILTARELRGRFTPFEPPADLVAVFDPRAGYLDPDACNRAHIDAARASGAVTRFDEPLVEWDASAEGIRVRTNAGEYCASRLLLSAGSWNGELAAELELPLTIERQSVFWLEPAGVDYEPDRFPIYAYEYKPGHICYGFPRLARGVKASVMHSGEIVDRPELVRRDVSDGDLQSLRDALRPVLPELAAAPVRERGTCIFTNTPDHDFIVDWHPQHPNVLVSSPCSGHGFKFASAIGELQADLLTDRPPGFDIAPFRLDRFAR
ncbi:MAG TPA: N-methyl-L-tryptophan oxidase [Gemmatimonadaceae bacterium]|nr:N-methyl-L-tryptophan oxidase [Gemmatimonadaceae bacterium]